MSTQRVASMAMLLSLFAIHAVALSKSPSVLQDASCKKFILTQNNYTATPGLQVEKTIDLWKGILLMVGFLVLAILLSIVHLLIRSYIYFDRHLLDTFFDAGGDVNMALLACGILAKWTWTSTYVTPTNMVKEYGIAGQFWFSVAGASQLFLFSIVASEIRIKAPGAKTYLQVIKARYGTATHLVLMLFALTTNIIICAMIMTQATTILTSLTIDLNKEVAALLIAVIVAIFAVVGGVGGVLYVSYAAATLVFCVALVYFCDLFFDPLSRNDNAYGSIESVYEVVKCVRSDVDNEEFSPLTFVSRGGLLDGISVILAGFSTVFVDQSYWQSCVTAKPGHSVGGFIIAGLTWFAVPMMLSFTFGLAYIMQTVVSGQELATTSQTLSGLIPVQVSQSMLSLSGDYMMFTMTVFCVIVTAAGEVLAISSIVVYDIYQAYVAPFTGIPFNTMSQQGTVSSNRMLQGRDELQEYDKRCIVLKHVVVISISILLLPITLIVLAIDIDVIWMYKALGVVSGSAVLPIALSITWHRTKKYGVMAGTLIGFCSAVAVLLIYASTFDGGLTKFRENTIRDEPMIAALATALGLGGVICICVSLTCGGCDPTDGLELEQWEKTRNIDNALLSWTVKYASSMDESYAEKGRPHFYTVRRVFRYAEVNAYLLGVLFTVCGVLVWPACMLRLDVFDYADFEVWCYVVLVWGAIAAGFIIIVPLVWEFVQICSQAYFNRQWKRPMTSNTNLGVYEDPPLNSAGNTMTMNSNRPLYQAPSTKSDIISTMDSGIDDKERYKTFIHLDS